MAGLNVHREVTVPSIGSQDFARTIDYYQNPTGSAITTTVRVIGNLGSDAATQVFATSSGDTSPSVNDEWFGTDGGGTPAVIHFVHGPVGLKPTSESLIGDNIVWTYAITVQPGETLELGTFTIQAGSEANAIDEVSALFTPTGFGGNAAEFLSSSDLAALKNFEPPIIVSPTNSTGLAIGTVGDAYQQMLSAGGGSGKGYTYSANGSLDGLTINASIGTLSGMPTASGTYTVTVTATDSNGDTGSQQYTLTVNPAIVVSSTSPTGLNIGTLNNAYSQQLSASGGAEGTFTFSTSSDLDGLNLSSTGLLSGNPAVAGSFPITVTATDSDGGTGSQDYTLVINQSIVVSPTSPTGLAIATLGNNYSQTISANGGAGGTYTFSTSTALDGLTLTSAGVPSSSARRVRPGWPSAPPAKSITKRLQPVAGPEAAIPSAPPATWMA